MRKEGEARRERERTRAHRPRKNLADADLGVFLVRSINRHVGIHYLEDSYAAESADMVAWLFGEDVYSLTDVLDLAAPLKPTSKF